MSGVGFLRWKGLGTQGPSLPSGALEQIERQVDSMGTLLRLTVEAASRDEALAASEAAISAVRRVEQRLSTWREDSELSRLNRAPVGEVRELSSALAQDLERARHWWQKTQGAFDPGIGALLDAYGVRQGGRDPTPEEIAIARSSGGFRALTLDGLRAVRCHPALRIEEGGFGKGIGLDAAIAAIGDRPVRRAVFDLGGQLALLGDDANACFAVADPAERDHTVLLVRIARGSLATSGNSERAIVVGGRRRSHLFDPRTGEPCTDFGSLTVHAKDATAADCLSTGLYVLGPESALDFAAARTDVDVLVLEPQSDGRLHARATGTLAGSIEILDPRVELSCFPGRPKD